MHTIVLSCAVLLKLSLGTQLEMNRILPEAGSYCLAHEKGTITVRMSFKDVAK